MKFLETLHKLDAYPKIYEEFQDKTTSKTIIGATVTVSSTILMLILMTTEVINFLRPNLTEELFVDTTRGHKLKINVDFYLPFIPCDYLNLDAMDSSGDQHLHIDHNVFKVRYDQDGNRIDEPKKEEIMSSTTKRINSTTNHLNSDNKTTEIETTTCGSCYGAQHNSTHCCNTCEDIIHAYNERKWRPNTENFEQCKNVINSSGGDGSPKFNMNEGCRIYGYMEVNRVGGSFHLAPGKSFSLNHIHVHDVYPYSSSSFNTSHIIHHLSFGERINFANTHPLDGMQVYSKEASTMFQYYIKIVPTMYIQLNDDVINTNQFSVTRHSKTASASSGESGMPGVFFSYELSPLMVKYMEKESSLGHLATNLCAIVGGIFTVAGIIESIFYNSVYAIQKKIELGKVN